MECRLAREIDMSKRLVIDARWLHTGIGRYVMNLLEGLQNRKAFSVKAIVRRCDESLVRPLCDEVVVVDLPIYGLREQMIVPWAARGCDLLHVPHYNAPVMYRGAFLVTIHDLIHLMDYPSHHPRLSKAYTRRLLRFATQRAKQVVTVSNFSKLQLMTHLAVPEEKITVIYNGVHPSFREIDRADARGRVNDELSLDAPYLLYVGNLKPHKNVGLLLQAFSLLRARKSCNRRLVIVGEGARERQLLQSTCTRIGISDFVRFIPKVDGAVLPYLYAAADLLVMPSLIEGFGYPVIEAMACGTPVVCSRTSALPEIAGDAAQFFDPTSCEDLASALEKGLQSRDLRNVLRQRGLDRAKVFAWDECGRNHAELYKKTMMV